MGVQALLLGILTVTGLVRVVAGVRPGRPARAEQRFETPARQAFVLEMVGPDDLRNAVSLNSVLMNVARAFGPAVAGRPDRGGRHRALLPAERGELRRRRDSLLRMDTGPLTPSTPAPREPGQLREGLAYVRRTPELAVPLLMMALVGCLAYEFQVVLPVVARSRSAAGRHLRVPDGRDGRRRRRGRPGRGGPRPHRDPRPDRAPRSLRGGDAGRRRGADLRLELAAMAVVGAVSVAFLSKGNSTLQLASAPDDARAGDGAVGRRVPRLDAVGGPIAGRVAEQFGGRAGLGLGAVACLVAAATGAGAVRRGERQDRAGSRGGTGPRRLNRPGPAPRRRGPGPGRHGVLRPRCRARLAG